MIGVPKRMASTHSRAICGARGQVDADVGMGEEPPQVHPGVDGDLAAQRPSSPGRCDRILERRRRPRRWKAGAEPGRGRRRLCAGSPAAVTQDEQVVGETEAVVPVPLGQPVHRDVHADGMRHRRTSVQRAPRGHGPSSRHPTGNGPRAARSATAVKRFGGELVDDDGGLGGQRARPDAAAPGVPMSCRSKAPSASRRPRPGHEDRHRAAAAGGSGDRTGDEGQLAVTVEPMAAHDDGRRGAHDPLRRRFVHAALQADAPRPAAARSPVRRGGHVGGDGFLGGQAVGQLVAMCRNGLGCTGQRHDRRRSDRPETRPAQARTIAWSRMFDPASDATERPQRRPWRSQVPGAAAHRRAGAACEGRPRVRRLVLVSVAYHRFQSSSSPGRASPHDGSARVRCGLK